MYNANIEVIDVSDGEEPKKVGKGKNKILTITYKSDEGKIEAKKLYDWATKTEVWEAVKSAVKGSFLNVEKEKNDKGFWDWMAVHRQDAMPVSVGSTARPVPTKPTYETPEERATKQVMIVRQSSIASAVNLLNGEGLKPGNDVVQTVINTAKQFESYVLGSSIYDLTNDIPN